MIMPTLSLSQRWLYFFIGLAVVVNFSGLFVPLMDPDAGVYASVSKNMLLRGDYVNLVFQDQDWLDKPHFPFWITAVFFRVFGLHDWSYKLPGILFVLLGAYYTYLFAKKYYDKTVALWAVFILLTAEHILISNNDVRAEPFLTGLIIASVYHFSHALSGKFFRQLAAGCFFAACAMMTKGLFTLIPIGAAVAGQLIMHRNWKQVFHWKWILALVLLGVFLSPELYCLWRQFDSHPEKIIFGKTNVSGIRFFLWDSQFGRFMNTGPIKGKGDPFFFWHTLLWAFLPWAFLMYASLYKKIREGIKQPGNGEWFTLSGSLLTLLVFSLSRFQLPYYTNIIFPFLSLLTARYAVQWMRENNRTAGAIQNSVAFLLPALALALGLFYRPVVSPVLVYLPLLLLLVIFIFLPRMIKNEKPALPYLRSGLAVLLVAIFLNTLFYPDLLKYQTGNEVACYINKNYPGIPVSRLGIYMPSGEFYLRQHMTRTDTGAIARRDYPTPSLLFITEAELSQLKSMAVPYEVVKEYRDFHITMLSLKFLDPAKREKELGKRYLVKL